jgi:hypothetical protein
VADAHGAADRNLFLGQAAGTMAQSGNVAGVMGKRRNRSALTAIEFSLQVADPGTRITDGKNGLGHISSYWNQLEQVSMWNAVN